MLYKEKRSPIYRMGYADPVSFSITKEKATTKDVLIDLWSRLKRIIKEKFKKKTVYPCCSFQGIYNTFSGTDIRFCVIKDGEEETIGEVQCISVNRDFEDGELTGDIKFVVFDHFSWKKLHNSKESYIVFLCAQNEYGANARFVFDEFRLISESWGIGIDDIIFENTISFEGRSVNGWEPLTKKEQ